MSGKRSKLSPGKQKRKNYDLQEHRRQVFGVCQHCRTAMIDYGWCHCYNERLKKNFVHWTSGNQDIDAYIREVQLKATNPKNLLEWIPYSDFENIEYVGAGGFSTVYSATRTYVAIHAPDSQHPGRKNRMIFGYPLVGGTKVVLKRIEKSFFMSLEFLNELKAYHQFNMENRAFMRCYGMTQDPDTLNYMIVLDYARHGDLRCYLKKNYRLSWEEKLAMLHKISEDLQTIHNAKFVHRDLHSGNILITDEGIHMKAYIADLGLARRADESPSLKHGIYGVLPYMAPEVLRGHEYTLAADIYSFGVIMWEFLTGCLAFIDRPHDMYLQMDVCDGLRPPIPNGAPECYVNLMRRSWDGNVLKRPSASELKSHLQKWHSDVGCKWNTTTYLAFKAHEELRKASKGSFVKEAHPLAVYHSRFVEYVDVADKRHPKEYFPPWNDSSYPSESFRSPRSFQSFQSSKCSKQSETNLDDQLHTACQSEFLLGEQEWENHEQQEYLSHEIEIDIVMEEQTSQN